MKNENKGEVHFSEMDDWQYYFEVDYDYSHSCWDYGCDEEGICRCATITDAKVESMTAQQAQQMAHSSFVNGSGEAGKFGRALAVRLFRHGLSNLEDMFEVNVCGGYYGDEIESVKLVDGQAWYSFQKEIERFNSSSNSERLRQVLRIEYGHVLPEVDQYKEWALIEVPLESVKASPDVLKRTSKKLVEAYQSMTPWYYSHIRNNRHYGPDWFPGVIVVPKDGDYRLIDGFHRFKAWTTKPQHLDEKKWLRLRKKNKITVIAPVV